MKEREVFDMLKNLSPQDVEKGGVLLDFAKRILAQRLDEYGVSVEMAGDGIEIECDIEPMRFSNLTRFWADGPRPAEVRGFRMPYRQGCTTEAERVHDFIVYCMETIACLDFLDWLNDNCMGIVGLGLTVDTVDFGYAAAGENEKHKFLVKFTDMHNPTQDGITVRGNIDEFFDLVHERDNAQVIAQRRGFWRKTGIDVKFTNVKDGKYAISADIRDENGRLEHFCDWPTSKEARAEIDKIYAERCGDFDDSYPAYGMRAVIDAI